MDKQRKSRFVLERDAVIIITPENEKQLEELKTELRNRRFVVPDHVQLSTTYERPTDGAKVRVHWDRKTERYVATVNEPASRGD